MGLDAGLLYTTDRLSADELTTFARDAETAGIESLWLPEVSGRDPFALAGHLFAHTDGLRVATGIANVYARDPGAMRAGAATLAELSGGRFMLGLGVSNPGINAARGNPVWEAPLTKMRGYLEAMDALHMTLPETSYPRYVAAHAQGLMAVARDHADGAHTYLMTAEHTRWARARLGAAPALSPVMFVLVETDPDAARGLIRRAIAYYMQLDYYHRAWQSLGFGREDFLDGGSDRLIDAVAAWGSLGDVRARLSAQVEAGANRVIVIPLNSDRGIPDWGLVREIVS